MANLLHELVSSAATNFADRPSVIWQGGSLSYEELNDAVQLVASGLVDLGLSKHDRVAVYLPKQAETVIGLFSTASAGGIFVPVNPVLKARQVTHILRDSGATILITSADRLKSLEPFLTDCPKIGSIVLSDINNYKADATVANQIIDWNSLGSSNRKACHRIIDEDIAALLYTSGSTGNPKGVILSHRNMVAGAKSVSKYLKNDPSDRILAVLPLSFDAGFSQLSTAFCSGASVILHNHYFASDIVKVVQKEQITGITAVPPLWVQIADQEWPNSVSRHVRYFANTGGRMPRRLLQKLVGIFDKAEPYLMYGLTEAFRSTYLPPAEVNRHPDSIGKAIPNADILVVRPDGSLCDVGEPGELVHRGALVAQGYWNDPVKTNERFRSSPIKDPKIPRDEIAVWSGDIVKMDGEGYLYFVGRNDEMIKTSGYRVSPTELEEAGFESGFVSEIAAVGLDDDMLGQRIVIIAVPREPHINETDALKYHFQSTFPQYMVPSEILWRESLPRNPNGKIDRRRLVDELEKGTGE